MEKYSLDTVKKYINGEDLDNYNVDQLEDDKKFMMAVINFSNDFNFYNLCSDEVKSDYEFVKYLVIKFKNNINFICKVADEFLEKTSDALFAAELAIIMQRLIKNKKENDYDLFVDSIYNRKLLEIEIYKAKNQDDFNVSQFHLFIDEFGSSSIIMEHYAKRFIKDIFKSNGINLENMLHSSFKNKEQIIKVGINSFLINIIERYDTSLSSYVCTNVSVLFPLKDEIQKILNNWDKYNREKEKEKYKLAFDKAYEYMENTDGILGDIGKYETIYYAAKELGIYEKLAKYDDTFLEEYREIIIEDLEDGLVASTIDINIKEYVHYLNVKKILSSIIFGNGKYELIKNKFNDDKTNEHKVISYDFKNASKK